MPRQKKPEWILWILGGLMIAGNGVAFAFLPAELVVQISISSISNQTLPKAIALGLFVALELVVLFRLYKDLQKNEWVRWSAILTILFAMNLAIVLMNV